MLYDIFVRGEDMTKEEMLIVKDMIKGVVGEELGPLRNEISVVGTKLDAMGERMDAMGERIDAMDSRLTRVEIKIENEIDRAIQVLGEGIAVINRKLDECIGLEHRVETLEDKMSAVEYALEKSEYNLRKDDTDRTSFGELTIEMGVRAADARFFYFENNSTTIISFASIGILSRGGSFVRVPLN